MTLYIFLNCQIQKINSINYQLVKKKQQIICKHNIFNYLDTIVTL